MSSTVWKRLRAVTERNDGRSAGYTVWRLPNDDEHVLNTGSPEDLLIDPEDVDIEVRRVQESSTVWTPQTFEEVNWYTFDAPVAEFYVRDVYEDEI